MVDQGSFANRKAMFAGKNKSGLTKEQLGLIEKDFNKNGVRYTIISKDGFNGNVVIEYSTKRKLQAVKMKKLMQDLNRDLVGIKNQCNYRIVRETKNYPINIDDYKGKDV